MLDQRLTGFRIGSDHGPVAYADDVTIFLRSITDLQVVEEAIQQFEKASGA
jgi:hypothetical protein